MWLLLGFEIETNLLAQAEEVALKIVSGEFLCVECDEIIRQLSLSN